MTPRPVACRTWLGCAHVDGTDGATGDVHPRRRRKTDLGGSPARTDRGMSGCTTPRRIASYGSRVPTHLVAHWHYHDPDDPVRIFEESAMIASSYGRSKSSVTAGSRAPTP